MSEIIEPNASTKIDPNESNKIKKNVSKQEKNTRNKTAYTPHFKYYLDTLLIPSLITTIGKILRTDTANLRYPTIQPTTVHLKQATGLGHSDHNHLPIGSLNRGIIIPRSRRNIYNRTVMKPQGPIVTTILESNRENNHNISNLVRKTPDIAYRVSPWHGTTKNETGNLAENLGDKTIFKNIERKDNSNVEKLGAKVL